MDDVLTKIKKERRKQPQLSWEKLNLSQHQGDWRVAFAVDKQLCQLSKCKQPSLKKSTESTGSAQHRI